MSQTSVDSNGQSSRRLCLYRPTLYAVWTYKQKNTTEKIILSLFSVVTNLVNIFHDTVPSSNVKSKRDRVSSNSCVKCATTDEYDCILIIVTDGDTK